MAKKPGKRTRRTNSQLFIDELTVLSDEGKKMVSNLALIEKLGWEKVKYESVKNQLSSENLILLGKGRGGSVGLAKAPGTRSLKLFVSYSHADEGAKTELLKHLKPLERMELIDEWHDQKLKAGEEWAGKISEEINTADIILLLVSIDFINSTYCYEIEMETALSRHENKEARVIPVVIRNCIWHSSPFAKLQALPKDAKPITSWSNQDDGYVSVADGIRQVAEELQSLQ